MLLNHCEFLAKCQKLSKKRTYSNLEYLDNSTMKSLFAVLALSVLITLLSGVQAQFGPWQPVTVRPCRTVVTDMAAKGVRLFENAGETNDTTAEFCVDFAAVPRPM